MNLFNFQWIIDNKLLTASSLLAFTFFISTTVALTNQINISNVVSCDRNYKMRSSPFNSSFKSHMNMNRLSRNVTPTNYKLLLHPNAMTKTFNGSVQIYLKIDSPTNNVTLHAKKLNFLSATLESSSENVSVSTEVSQELLIIKTSKVLNKGAYTLKIQFAGVLDGIVGFYASSKGNRTMVASKFQPTYARQAFPCFDEPDFKATFDITLVKPQNYVALSNMNEVSRTIDNATALETVTFATSVPMSTYLACFVICDFDFKETEINSNGIGNNFILRSFAQKDQTHKIDFAQDIGKRATEFYVKYYEVPFPLPKLDMIAIPDYVSGATEHWGLVTYRETSFLVDEATASAANKISVANTIAHELAHMWFGNLVTMKWWDEVWLNEGFASYMQVKSLNAIEPSWTMLDQFLIKTMHSVLVTDAKSSSHPIVQTVDTPDQITAIFDSISYNKGASILRMLEGFIGEENFRKGVSDYLKKHKFGNTVTQDLLACLEPYFKTDHPDLSLQYIMDTWTRQKGYPLLTVSKEANSYRITQSRFLLNPEAVSLNDSEFDYRWFVPITYKTNKGVNEKVLWFDDKRDAIEIEESDVSWLKINNNQVGYYRVNYPQDMWQNLIGQLKSKSNELTISDRSHLLNDVFALAESGKVPYELALNLSTYLTIEEDYVPWQTAASVLIDLADRLATSLAHEKMLTYIQQLVLPIYQKQRWEPSNLGVIERLLRTRILSLATRAELPAAEDMVRSLFLNWLNSHGTSQPQSVETDLRDLVYYYGMKSASHSEWDKLWQIYKKEEDAQEQAKLRRALAAPRDTAILRKYLMLAWDESNIRGQDYLNVIQFISANPSGTALVWDDVRSRWQQLVERFTLNSRYLGNAILGITGSFDTDVKLRERPPSSALSDESVRRLSEAKPSISTSPAIAIAAEMESFFKQYPEAGAGESARLRAFETVRNNAAWTAAFTSQIEAWLACPDSCHRLS